MAAVSCLLSAVAMKLAGSICQYQIHSDSGQLTAAIKDKELRPRISHYCAKQ